MTARLLSRRRALHYLRRAAQALFVLQLSIVTGLTLVDSWRRRGKKRVAFPVTPVTEVAVGSGTVTTYTFGADLYADMLAAIRSARQQILFESFIWKGDAVGAEFKQALEEAATRGVDVYAVYDGFANLVVPRAFKRFDPAVRVAEYPTYNAGLKFFDLSRYGRDHRKILVVDHTVAFVGGYNIGSAYATQWRDTHVKLTGPGVWDIKRAFTDFWNMQHKTPLSLEAATDWDPHIRVHRNVPRMWMFPIRSMYLEAIDRAHRYIYLTHAYFIPDQGFVETLLEACARGVDVRLLLPATSNHVVADWLSRGYYSTLLDGGVRLYLYQDSMVHAKTATIDGRWSTIGTANIDRLSMTGNYEVNVEVVDDALARQMEAIFETDLGNSRELTAEHWRSRGVARRFAELVLAPLRPLL